MGRTLRAITYIYNTARSDHIAVPYTFHLSSSPHTNTISSHHHLLPSMYTFLNAVSPESHTVNDIQRDIRRHQPSATCTLPKLSAYCFVSDLHHRWRNILLRGDPIFAKCFVTRVIIVENTIVDTLRTCRTKFFPLSKTIPAARIPSANHICTSVSFNPAQPTALMNILHSRTRLSPVTAL